MGTHITDLDEELFEDEQALAPPREAVAPEKRIQPLVDRFEPRYRPLGPRNKGHSRAWMAAAILLVALVAIAGWYLGNHSPAPDQASQVVQAEKQNRAP